MTECNDPVENIDVIVDHSGERPDISTISQGRAPVVIAAEFEPALKVEETKGCLNSCLKNQTRRRYRLFHANNDRFPKHGWPEGLVIDLADLIYLITIPQRVF